MTPPSRPSETGMPDVIVEIHRKLGIPAEYMRGKSNWPLHGETTDLVSLESRDTGQEETTVEMTPVTAAAWLEMRKDASARGIELMTRSAFRSWKRQARLIEKALANREEPRTLPEVLTRIAPPGFSEHHTGCAIDIGCPECFPPTQDFAKTRAYAWLTRNARRYGFRMSYPENNPFGIIFEPWHWIRVSKKQ